MNIPKFTFKILGCAMLIVLPGQIMAQITSASINLQAMDSMGQPTQNLVAGQYVRLDVSASFANLPPKAQGRIQASALFTTMILGRKVAYQIRLPLTASAGSSIDPTVGMLNSGLPLENLVPQKSFREILDFQIPPQTPAGKLLVTVHASAAKAQSLTRTFSFNVVRP